MPCLAPRLVLPKIIPSFFSLFLFYFVIPNQCFFGGRIFATNKKKKGRCKKYNVFFLFFGALSKNGPKLPHYDEDKSKNQDI
jgi:hypothetical protein